METSPELCSELDSINQAFELTAFILQVHVYGGTVLTTTLAAARPLSSRRHSPQVGDEMFTWRPRDPQIVDDIPGLLMSPSWNAMGHRNTPPGCRFVGAVLELSASYMHRSYTLPLIVCHSLCGKGKGGSVGNDMIGFSTSTEILGPGWFP